MTDSFAPSIARDSTCNPAGRPAAYLVAIGHLQRLPRWVQVTIFAAVFVVIAAFDIAIDSDLSFFALYLIPTLYAAWFLGERWSYFSCVLSTLVWGVDDWGQAILLHHRLIPYLNLGSRFLVLGAIIAAVNALKTALEHEHGTARKAVQREFEIASEVQNRLLPLRGPNYPGLEFAYFYQPAREVGGDYFDFIPFDSEQIGFAIGDVSGKGISSALLMASLQSLVRTNLAARAGEAAQFASEVNDAFYEITSSSRYATLFFACVDASRRSIRYVNAGHNPPLVFRTGATSTPELLDAGGHPVGLLPGGQYRTADIVFNDNDVLVAFTDGVPEALNAQNEEFGQERIEAIVRESQTYGAEVICQRIEQALREFMAGSSQWDDITLVVIKVTGGSSSDTTPTTTQIRIPR